MSDYELVLVFSPKANGEAKKLIESVEKAVTSAKGKVTKKDEWGKRALAYPISKLTEGVYYYLELTLPADEVGRLERKIKLEENVIRHLLVRREGSKKKQ